MARAGDVITNPRSGERIVFLSTGAETGGESLVLEYKAPAGRRGPPAHIHARHEERFDVLSGTAIVRLGKVERALGPGRA